MSDLRSDAIRICGSDELVERGTGRRFPVKTRDGDATGFVVRFDGAVHGYLNRCAHASVELDWDRGRFFEGSGLYLMCATHGAIYDPTSGRCAGGPCRGQGLRVIAVEERDGDVVWLPDERTFAVA